MGVDVVDCSSGGMRGSPVVSAGPVSYGYQVPYAERLKADGGVMSMAVGLIVHADQAEAILQNGQADLIAIAREAMERKSGARGLRAILENLMLDVMYEVPSIGHVKECIVSEEVVHQGKQPILVYENEAELA